MKRPIYLADAKDPVEFALAVESVMSEYEFNYDRDEVSEEEEIAALMDFVEKMERLVTEFYVCCEK